MVDRLFSEAILAELYDLLAPWGEPDDAFFLELVLSATSVLDVGCGTGLLLREARTAGHTGRLCGLDPANAMLDQARTRSDIEWILGDLESVSFEREFDLIVMTGHAFQVFLTDEQLHAALVAVHAALTSSGRFAFETRNPLARRWERWTPEHAIDVVTAAGAVVRFANEVETPVDGEIVRFTSTFTSPSWDQPQLSQSTLRFIGAESLDVFLAAAGLTIEHRFGNWDRQPLTDTSPEIVIIARRV